MKDLCNIIIIVILLMLTSCEGEQGNPGESSLIDIVTEHPGLYCIAGGIKILNGIDQNNDGLDRALYVCR
jgi:hypothetical protein